MASRVDTQNSSQPSTGSGGLSGMSRINDTQQKDMLSGILAGLKQHGGALGSLAGEFAFFLQPFVDNLIEIESSSSFGNKSAGKASTLASLPLSRRESGKDDLKGGSTNDSSFSSTSSSQPSISSSSSQSPAMQKLNQGLREHARLLRRMAEYVEASATKLETGDFRKKRNANSKSKADRSNKPDHIVSDEPCDSEDRNDFDLILAKQPQTVSEFWKKKYENEAGKYWNLFYKRNMSNFFKDRHYLQMMLEADLAEVNKKERKEGTDGKAAPSILFEVGCGCGNTMFPLLQDNPSWHVYGVDISPHAIDLIKRRDEFKKYQDRCQAWVCDLVSDDLPETLANGAVDIATLIFVLSAIHPEKIPMVLRKVYKSLKPGGKLVIRDYAVYDLSQLRFGDGAKLGENLYVRQDGTRTFFFSKDTLSKMLREAGFEVVEIKYHRKVIRNIKKGIAMKRTWIQARVTRGRHQ